MVKPMKKIGNHQTMILMLVLVIMVSVVMRWIFGSLTNMTKLLLLIPASLMVISVVKVLTVVIMVKIGTRVYVIRMDVILILIVLVIKPFGVLVLILSLIQLSL